MTQTSEVRSARAAPCVRVSRAKQTVAQAREHNGDGANVFLVVFMATEQTFVVCGRESRWPVAPRWGAEQISEVTLLGLVGTQARERVTGRPRAITVRPARAASPHRATLNRSKAHADLRAFNGDDAGDCA